MVEHAGAGAVLTPVEDVKRLDVKAEVKPEIKQDTDAVAKKKAKWRDDKHFKIFSGTANRALAEEVCKFVGIPLGEVKLQRFSDGEVYFQLTPAGETMLQHANGNQLAAQVKLTSGHDTATAQVALIAYG